MSDELQQIADDVRELTQPRRHVEPRWIWTPSRNRKLDPYVTEQPSLLGQLRALAADPLTTDAGEGARAVPGSKTPEGAAAFELLLAIEAGSAWLLSGIFRQPLRRTVEENLSGLVACAAADEGRVDFVAADVARWRSEAEVVTGWRDRAKQPYARCPVCNRLGSLRVDLRENRARCVGCGTAWSAETGTIGLLADHIRQAAEVACDTPTEAVT